MNQLECKQLLKLLEKGDLELLKTYVEDTEDFSNILIITII